MLNNQYSDSGLQLTWLAPTDTYLLFGAEVFSGDNYPAGGAAHSGNGADTVFVKMSRDVNDSNTWFAGLSYMPALVTRSMDIKWGLPAAFVLGSVGYAAGLILSTVFDLPSGALMVWCLVVLAIIMGSMRRLLPEHLFETRA